MTVADELRRDAHQLELQAAAVGERREDTLLIDAAVAHLIEEMTYTAAAHALRMVALRLEEAA